MKRILAILSLFLVSSFGCGGEPPTAGDTEQAVINSYHLGTEHQGTFQTIANPHPGFGSVTYASLAITLPLYPVGPSSSSAFTFTYGIGYFGGNQQNSASFRIERTPSAGFGTYHIHVDMTTGDGTGGIGLPHEAVLNNYLTGSAFEGDTVSFVWVSAYYGPPGYVAMARTVPPGSSGSYYVSRPWEWAANTGLPNFVYNPVATFTVNSAVGCAHDMPDSNSDNFNGSFNFSSVYGVPLGSGTAGDPYIFKAAPIIFPPTSGCSLDAINGGTPVDYDSTVTWSDRPGT